MGHYDECRPEYCAGCRQTNENCTCKKGRKMSDNQSDNSSMLRDKTRGPSFGQKSTEYEGKKLRKLHRYTVGLTSGGTVTYLAVTGTSYRHLDWTVCFFDDTKGDVNDESRVVAEVPYDKIFYITTQDA